MSNNVVHSMHMGKTETIGSGVESKMSSKKDAFFAENGRHETLAEAHTRLTKEHTLLCEAMVEISEFVRSAYHIFGPPIRSKDEERNNKKSGYIVPLPDKGPSSNKGSSRASGNGSGNDEETLNAGDAVSAQELRARVMRAEMRIMELESQNRRLILENGSAASGPPTAAVPPLSNTTGAPGTNQYPAVSPSASRNMFPDRFADVTPPGAIKSKQTSPANGKQRGGGKVFPPLRR